ncbi:PREDICTED: uncharacterized protein LOC109186556 [Ipomoea nil]|uniref:uncharacterized protein LOC109186556 n=1 Tax=Ipomoea nil TaxID=35883 RepID=UPI000901DB7B|nr:PREDICTED: uncharacterized protein LOC109186556 [Ipomoea nil]
MATLSSPTTFLLLLLSFSFFPFIIYGAKENTLIQKTCKIIHAYNKNFIHYDFCISALQARPAKECATLRGIGMTCINLIMNNVTDTRRHIRGVVNSGKVQPWVRRCVDECYDLYDRAVTRVGNALMDYKHKKYMEAEAELSMVMDSVMLCDMLFMKGRSRDKPAGGCGGESRRFRRGTTTLPSCLGWCCPWCVCFYCIDRSRLH